MLTAPRVYRPARWAAAAPFVVTALSLAACGTITFGDDRSPDSGVVIIEDAVVDAGPRDTGYDGGPDLGPIDLGCVPDPEPPLPSSWPFETSVAKYQELFVQPLERASAGVIGRCSQNSCHGVRPVGIGPAEQGERHAPFIPTADEVTMYGQPLVDVTIQQLWTVMTDRVGEDPTIVTSHDPARGPQAATDSYVWRPGEMEKLQELVEEALTCRWKPLYSSRDGGTECTGGGPPPQDAGAPPDTGTVPTDAGPDAGATDAADAGPAGDGAADAGAPPPDAGVTPDAGAPTGEQCSCPFTASQIPSAQCVN